MSNPALVREIRSALIGTGAIGREHLKCLKRQPGVRIVAVCDRLSSLAEMAADEFGVPEWYTDYHQMLREAHPDVVHITTPAGAHYELAKAALRARVHVFVEKPATCEYGELLDLTRIAGEEHRWLIEDHNYLFNKSCQDLLHLAHSGTAGGVRHVAINFCANLLGPGSPFADASAPHPSLAAKGGMVSDFLPHLAYLALAFGGPHRAVQTMWRRRSNVQSGYDEFIAIIDAPRASVSLYFSASVEPSTFDVRLFGTKLVADAELFEPRLVVARQSDGAAALLPTRNGLRQAHSSAVASFRSVTRRLAGQPVALEGMWNLIRLTYRAIGSGGEPPVTLADITDTARLVHDLAATCDQDPS